jgi:two-component system cell cycle sensor histidine kinase/response regulator CckA
MSLPPPVPHVDDLPLLVVVTDEHLAVLNAVGRDALALPHWRGHHVLEVLDGLSDPAWVDGALQGALRHESAGRDTRWRGVPVVVRVVPNPHQRGALCLVMARAVSPYERSAHFYEAILESSQTFAAVMDARGVLRFVSPPAQQLLGFAPEELLSRPFSDLVHPEDVALARASLEHLVAQPGGHSVLLLRARTKSGGWRQLEMLTTNLLDDPEVAGVVASARDVTENLEAWRAVEQGETFYRTLLEHAFDMIVVTNSEGTRRYVSPAMARLLGFTQQEYAALPGLAAVHPDDQAMLADRTAEALRSAGMRIPLELRLVHRDGSHRVLAGVVRNMSDEPTIRGLVFNLRDVTRERDEARARARLEQAYQALTTASPYAVYQLDPTGLLTSLNEAGTRILAEAGPAVGLSLTQLGCEGDRAALAAAVARAAQGDASEFEFTTVAGRLIRASLVPVRGPEGAVVHLAGLGQDITRVRGEQKERDALEAQLRQAQKLESIGQLAGGIAHDFNNILMVILAHVSFLERTVTDRGSLQDLDSIRGGAQRASELTRQLLTVSRKQPVSLAPMDVNERLRALSNMLRRLLPENMEFDLTEGAALPRVDADASQFDQVMLNLCVNARDAMPNGGRLSLRTEAATISEEYHRVHPWAHIGHHVLITVTDTGVGMTEQVRARIFEPFFTTKEPGRGTGLGLAMVYGIVQRHGGMVHCYSEPGVGTTFRVYLPAVRSDAAAPSPQGPARPQGGSEQVLVAEDDPGVREVVCRVLGRAGYTVLEATHGEEAVALALTRDVALVLMDSVMPRLSGQDAYLRIKQERPHQRFLFSSGYSSDGFSGDFLRREGVALIQKPYDPDALLRAVRQALDAR